MCGRWTEAVPELLQAQQFAVFPHRSSFLLRVIFERSEAPAERGRKTPCLHGRLRPRKLLQNTPSGWVRKRRPPLVPVGGLFIGVGNLQNEFVAPRRARNL